MTQLTRRSPILALLATTAIIFAACGGAASAPPPTAAPVTAAPATAAPTEAPYQGSVYPATGEAPCGTAGYTGNFKKITAVDRLTVQFDLCAPDVAFLAKIAFSAFGIQDADYLAGHDHLPRMVDPDLAPLVHRRGIWAIGGEKPPARHCHPRHASRCWNAIHVNVHR